MGGAPPKAEASPGEAPRAGPSHKYVSVRVLVMHGMMATAFLVRIVTGSISAQLAKISLIIALIAQEPPLVLSLHQHRVVSAAAAVCTQGNAYFKH